MIRIMYMGTQVNSVRRRDGNDVVMIGAPSLIITMNWHIMRCRYGSWIFAYIDGVVRQLNLEKKWEQLFFPKKE
jgi:hypothetical protein